MRMMSELNHMFLYSAKKKVYVPINEKNRRFGSAILLLTPSMEDTMHLTMLPYLFNPDLFMSYYIDRNVSAFIDKKSIAAAEDFDEVEAKAVSEAMVNYTNKIKFKMDSVSSMDERYIRNAYDMKIITPLVKTLGILKIPDVMNVVVHPNLGNLKKNAPSDIAKQCGKDYFSYTDGTTIHILSHLVYDAFTMRGNYDIYLLSELLYALIVNFNNNIPYVTGKGIAYAFSGLYDYLEKESNSDIGNHDDKAINFGSNVAENIMTSDSGMRAIRDYIRSGNMNLFVKFTARKVINHIRKAIFEGSLSYMDRQRLLPSEFGLPNKREYPINDEEHVRLAVKMFNHCDPEDEKELAQNIIKRIKRYGIYDIHPSASNRFSKYYKNPKVKPVRESACEMEEEDDDKWNSVRSICNNLSPQELGRITFTDDYENSQFVIKRYIVNTYDMNEDGSSKIVPAGFLDIYQFPSNPEIAQITIAVDGRYRGRGLARELVSQLVRDEKDLAKQFGFETLYWTAHQDNFTSQYLATHVGLFTDTEKIDKYGRKVYIKPINVNTKFGDYEIDNNPGENMANISKDAIVTNEAAFLYEANSPDRTTYLRRYLYSDRIKNDKTVLSMYKQAKLYNPNIKYTFLRLDMYKNRNLFVDLSYYHALFLKNNMFKKDNAVNFYFEFLNKLINNKDINNIYHMQTIFIPIDKQVWNVQPGTEFTDYRSNINPISIIFRLIRTNPDGLRRAWGNKDIVFVSDRGYFKVDFKLFDVRDLARFKKNIRKLTGEEPITDEDNSEYPEDDLTNTPETSATKSSTKAIANSIVDKLEKNGGIKIDDISQSIPSGASLNHLSMITGPIDITTNDTRNGVVIIDMSDGPSDFKKLNDTVLSNLSTKVNTYCMPK